MTRVIVMVCLLAVFLSGCNTGPKMNYAAANLVKAGGTVTLDGKPLPDAVVTFESPVDGTTANGLTKSNGSYTLMFDSVMAGVAPGKKIVRISTTKKVLGLNITEEGGGGEGADGKPKATEKATELVPVRYNKDSELTVEVTSGQTRYNFDLKSN